MKPQNDDHRYPILITLLREGRPKYWSFHCMHCGSKVCELDGTIVHARDVSQNTDDGKSSPMRVRCLGSSKIWCRLWYEIQLYN